MKVVELYVGSISHLTAKLPPWVRLLLAFWILLSGAMFFGWVDLPVANQWLRMFIMAPMIPVVLMVLATMIVFFVTWVTWPFRKLAKLVQEKRHG